MAGPLGVTGPLEVAGEVGVSDGDPVGVCVGVGGAVVGAVEDGLRLPGVDCGAPGRVGGGVDFDDVDDAGGVVFGDVCVAGWLPPNRLVPLPDRS